jgi:DNA polymerase-3 subunit alpha
MKEYINQDYINFHVHAIGSLRDGIIKISGHVNFALKNKKKFVPVADHGSISEWIELYTQCNKNKLIPIYGVELYIVDNREKFLIDKTDKPDHLCLFALNETGYYNIIKIVNDAWKHFYKKPIASYDVLFEKNEGVVATSACMSGAVAKALLNNDLAGADAFIEKMQNVFGDNRFFIEIMLIDMKEQLPLNKKLIKFAQKHNVPTLITNDAHYLQKEHVKAHQYSLLMQSNKTIDDLKEGGKGWKFSAQNLWLKNETELHHDWERDYKDDDVFTEEVFIKSAENCKLITKRIETFYIEKPPRLPKYKNGSKLLKEMIYAGFNKKLEEGFIPKEKEEIYLKQTVKEFDVIKDLELVDYFLLIKDILDFCKEKEIAVGPGRGSSSASLICWLIDITKLDPIKYNFIFERFLNPARKTSMKIFHTVEEDEEEYKKSLLKIN